MSYFGLLECQWKKRSSELFDMEKVNESTFSNVPNHAIDRYIERVGKGKIPKGVASVRIGQCLSLSYRREHFLGSEANSAHGKTYYYMGYHNNVRFIIPQSYMGCVYTILPWVALFKNLYLMKLKDAYLSPFSVALVPSMTRELVCI